MARVIVVTSGKGGVGKTTVTANLGSALSQLGCRVALVDADFGLRNLDLLLGLEQRIVYTAIDVVAGDCSLDKALVKDKRQENTGSITGGTKPHQRGNYCRSNEGFSRPIVKKLRLCID